MVHTDSDKDYIYKMSWYSIKNGKRDKESHSDMYFALEKDTEWVYDRYYGKDETFTVKKILVDKSSSEYSSAIYNSKNSEKRREQGLSD